MSAQTKADLLPAAYEIVEILEGASPAGEEMPAEVEERVREKLPLVGVDELVGQLREVEGVTSSLMEMGSVLTPATYCVLSGAHERARKALEAAAALRPQA